MPGGILDVDASSRFNVLRLLQNTPHSNLVQLCTLDTLVSVYPLIR